MNLGMSMVISHNLAAMNANRQLNITTGITAKSSEKLSSGYRINRAADDAAGLAISEKMRRQIRGLTQGTENTQDGISMCQIADGALDEVSAMLQRVTELSVKAANDTNTSNDRQYIQQEINQISTEIDRVCDTTTFNEQPIFQGATGVTIIPATYEPTTISNYRVSGTPTGNSAGMYRISVDASGFTIDGTNHSWSEFTDGSGRSLGDASIFAGTYSFTYNGVTMSVDAENGASMDDVVGTLNGAGFTTKVTSSVTKKLSDLIKISFNPGWSVKGIYTEKEPRITFSAEDMMLSFETGLLDYYSGEEIVGICDLNNHSHWHQTPYGESISLDTKIVDEDSQHINVAHFDFRSEGDSVLFMTQLWIEYFGIEDDDYAAVKDMTVKDAIDILTGITMDYEQFEDSYESSSSKVYRDNDGSYGSIHYPNDKIIETNVTLALDKTISTNYHGKIITPEQRISSDEDKKTWIHSGSESNDGLYLTFGRMDTNILGISGLDVLTQQTALNTIDRTKNAIIALSGIRSDIGAQQNRLEHIIKSQNNTIENTQSAESIIRDTDMATEMVRYSNENILAQAGQAILVQANQTNQGVLSLLQ